MAKVGLAATTTVEQTVSVKLAPKVKTMVVARAEEHAKLALVIKVAKARQSRIKEEVQELFVKGGEGKALVNGTEIDGHKIKLVTGTRKSLNKVLFEELGGDLSILAEATEEKDNEPYVKITAPGEKES